MTDIATRFQARILHHWQANDLHADPDKVTPRARLIDLDFDSLDAVELQMDLEDHFEAELPDGEVITLDDTIEAMTARLVACLHRQPVG